MKLFLWISFLSAALGCSLMPLEDETTFTEKKDFVYQTHPNKKLTMDIFTPGGVKDAPMVVMLHGGGWRARSGDMHAEAQALAKRGFLVFNTTYRLAPTDNYPAAVDDVRFAVKYVREKAAEFGGDPKKIYLWGYSAGGHLALLAGLDPALGVSGIVAGAAPVDFTVYGDSPLVNRFMGKPLKEYEAAWREASPVFHVSEKSPPVFLYHGEWDKLVEIEQMWKMKRALEEKKVPVRTHVVEGQGHISVYLISTESVKLGVQFLEELAAR